MPELGVRNENLTAKKGCRNLKESIVNVQVFQDFSMR